MDTTTAEGGQTGTEQQVSQTGQQQTGQAPASSATGQADPWADFAWDGKVESLPEPVAKLIRDARADAGKARTTAKETAATEARNQLAQEIGKALGLIKDDGQADPAKLTEQIGAERAGKHEALVKVALYETASEHGGNPAALKDSVSFLAKVAKLDPSDGQFTAQVAAAAKEAVEANPALKAAAQAAARSGGEFTGGPGGDAVSPEQFQRMSVAQRNELFQRDPNLYRKLAGR